MNKQAITIGQYIILWCSKHGITRKDFKAAVGYHYATSLKRMNSLSLEKYFAIAEYMSETSKVLSVEFYLKRLKDVLQGQYKLRTQD